MPTRYSALYDYGIDNEYPSYTLLHKKRVVARKDHVCNYCKQPIKKGTTYVSHAMMYDGEFRYNRSHPDYLGECITN